ncbi:Alcohol dehydrogenase zinc-binding domain protein OS=Tsukamurella paurometabola (strain ATCC 8368/ DSM / CCUG 35730 / CIP 100753 / JCM 10117 / KCTC 9821/ NBRC 16120 / NCIMB 702349 / NCTC 13040) OX=521096 GN=Tpau_1661 PE=4 SV=1 [Tsukamurella paurometabola]|uniref:Alcohol dehydrogenase zinc-binding domain protein n=1 Tax=Tsukamurella paurometabola (strain ATCC 8368 / DSM 20162 / CCUG 35730 / CIP 100753 / JCM 10117 / KCTC 9821 / NBRC 16120 / NCIMB 702349 / NCTC 13040) TaxID=521096 RepID=D5UYH4_TSUPD|nr:zinc-binding dehydrogenase [Tsukamurella paurometabola]ADG78281.1 Alcohol dehydrogenase zinc-binding domain protein [Tsukamurella paurometabola DSM 20162]SUP31016.1 Beta-ketoacyl-acyl-carrier-protein synthase I [Tsukamurella paurometabola]
MKAVIATYAETPVLADLPAPTPSDVLIPVHMSAVALHNLTRGVADGRHYASPADPGFVIGVDGVGITADGRRVYVTTPGTAAEVVHVPESALTEVPDGLDDVQAAAAVNAVMSSWMAMTVRTQVRPGQTVLVLGATGGSGRPAVAVARHLGARVIAAGRNAETLAAVGADATIDLTAPEGEVAAALGAEKIDVVLDYLWGRPAELTLAALAHRGPAEFVQVGTMAGAEIALPGALLRSTDIRLLGSGFGSFTLDELAAARPHILDAIRGLGITMDVDPVPAERIAEIWRRDPAGKRVVLTLR